MSFIEVIIISGGVIAGSILLLIGLKKGWFKTVQLSLREGLIIDIPKQDSETINKLNAHSLSQGIADIDAQFKYKHRRLVFDMRVRVQRGFVASDLCDMTRAALAWSFYIPLMLAVEENHFRQKFLRSKIQNYLNDITKEIQGEYDLLALQAPEACVRAKLPSFSDITGWVETLLREQWVKKILEIMIWASESKIALYSEYLKKFTATGDTYNMQVCETCIDKNKAYIKELREMIV